MTMINWNEYFAVEVWQLNNVTAEKTNSTSPLLIEFSTSLPHHRPQVNHLLHSLDKTNS